MFTCVHIHQVCVCLQVYQQVRQSELQGCMSIGEWVWVVCFVRYLTEPSVCRVSNEEILIVQGT